MRIRAARLEDAAEIARLAAELGYPNDVAAMHARLRELLSRSEHWVGVAEEVGQGAALAGWVHVARCVSVEGGAGAEILGLVVDAHTRRAGLGRRLVDSAEQWGRARGLACITVRSNAARVESHPFYAALGYARPKTQHVYQKQLNGHESA